MGRGFGSMAKADARALLAIARRDLQAAQGMEDASSFHEAVWGFQVQQVVEKSLRAWLYLFGRNPPFTHDLVALFKMLQEEGINITTYRPLARFTDFAVQIRYDEQPDLQDLDRSLWNDMAKTLVEEIKARLQHAVEA